MILITTAGKVGAEAARLLAQRGEPVRVLVRDPDKATALVQAGAAPHDSPAAARRALDSASLAASMYWLTARTRAPVTGANRTTVPRCAGRH